VQVDATVTNSHGNPVPDLKACDFRVLLDRKPQEIQYCNFVRVSVTPASLAIPRLFLRQKEPAYGCRASFSNTIWGPTIMWSRRSCRASAGRAKWHASASRSLPTDRSPGSTKEMRTRLFRGGVEAGHSEAAPLAAATKKTASTPASTCFGSTSQIGRTRQRYHLAVGQVEFAPGSGTAY